MGKFKNLSFIVSMVVTGVMAISVLIVLLPNLLGMTITVIRDQQMAPTYEKGSLLFVKKMAPSEIYVGEVITYYVNEGESIKTRRVVAKEKGKEAFYAKGDGQEQMEIGLISSRNLIGQPLFHLPYLGLLVSDGFLNVMVKLFWIFTGFLTFTTVWLYVERLRKRPVISNQS